MAIDTFPLLPKASISLALMANPPKETRGRAAAIRAVGMLAFEAPRRAAPAPQRAAVIVQARDPGAVADRVGDAKIEQLSESFLSVEGDVGSVANITQLPEVRRVQTKKLSQMHLNEALPDIGLIAPQAGPRPAAEDGTGVVVGIVDSGFDLSHPMFRDKNRKLRVDALLDQTLPQPREFTTAQLERGWASNSRPGDDDHGHGTHVASIAAGSKFRTLEGVAPGARLILVKTNFVDTDIAVSWIFSKAGNRPCVINMSLGHHYGAHDGTDAEELLHTQLTGPGKIIVISAGNEREDDLHIGGRFHKDQTDVVFDVQRQPDGSASVVLTLWHDRSDRFSVSLVTPAGKTIAEPSLEHASRATFGAAVIDISQQRFQPGKAIQHQIGIDIGAAAANNQLRGWRVRIACRKATVGRIDGWFNNSGFAAFRAHPLLENARTVGLSATGAGCLAVASHVSKAAWASDLGDMTDDNLVVGRSSPFSSLGPTRTGGQKPDLSAPGQMVTAALASDSEMAGDDQFAKTGQRLLTIAGTSMAAPVVTGAVALLLQQQPGRTLADIREILSRSVRRDAHTGPAPWDPFYGLGKLDIAAALHNG
jgi:subtilisin family serine protease